MKALPVSLPDITLVLGGAASGKSGFAESLCFQAGKPKTYIATAQAFDDEMRDKIKTHRLQRGENWLTIEAHLDLGPALSERTPDEIVLLDCATLWLSNVLLADQDLDTAMTALMTALTACHAQIVVVSNEVGNGIVPDNALSRQFRNAQGRLNQRLAAQAGLVVQVIAGLPQVLKGTLP
ncbi:bifunctional adenosylcobinamide kinase/adenosylcobinamide-phosphate guanylyltransferase [Octadecabacter sp. 1_MG-2023]|uniref:bifunctional adenosylcobinamide kinase/adenosylcobinamide-phosphate guanylyltransferase n=1 Tax=unclassified Octadecabacter TaxID=196158 RepID=UPI001C081A39|nr:MULTISPECIES: bifunctional adenosylcobinamide kinase/adenosylcobinamide-phosphate guanylyltransferase [unclassified Octadecabacter]MBU2991830.1 bifunctional adenosylcobinamide kinase/adenosylcobinamide-phosphate guanylyltransferase [Octadecabacter sp. B2R22]MDO6735804.1 bifunctional adenosylcobinamide kinase/adenosylcobinamide-phosphate guanylyltransferase [Octadecabacter sp. 1_MG-2023]